MARCALVLVLLVAATHLTLARITGTIGEVKYKSGLGGGLAALVTALRGSSSPRAYYDARLQVESRAVEFPDKWFTRADGEAPKLRGPNAKVLHHNPEDKSEKFAARMAAALERSILTARASGTDFNFEDDGLMGSKVQRAQQTVFFHYNSVLDLLGVTLSKPETLVVSTATVGESSTSNSAAATTEFSKGLRLDTASAEIQEAIRGFKRDDPPRFRRNMQHLLSSRSAYWDATAVAHEVGHRLMRSVYKSDQWHTVSTSLKDGIGEAVGDFLACVHYARTFGFAPGHDNAEVCVIAPYYANDIHAGVRSTGYRRSYASADAIPIDVKADVYRADWVPPAGPKYARAKTDEHFHGQPVADVLWGLTLPAVLGGGNDEEGRDRAVQVVKLGMAAMFAVFEQNKYKVGGADKDLVPALLTLRNCVLAAAQQLFGDGAATAAYAVFKSHGVGWDAVESQRPNAALAFTPDNAGALPDPFDGAAMCPGLAVAAEAAAAPVLEADEEMVVLQAHDDPDGDGDEDDPNVDPAPAEMPLQAGAEAGGDEEVMVPLGEEVVNEAGAAQPEAAVVVGGDAAPAAAAAAAAAPPM